MKKKLIWTTLSSLLLLTCFVSLNLYRLATTTLTISLPNFSAEQYAFFQENPVIDSSFDNQSQALIHDQVLVWLSEKNNYRPQKMRPMTKLAKKINQVKKVEKQIVSVEQYKVNGQQRFKHYGFEHQLNVEIIGMSAYLDSQNVEETLAAINEATTTKTLIASKSEEENKITAPDILMSMLDEVNTQLAATEDTDQERVIEISGINEIDLVLIDYSKSNQEKPDESLVAIEEVIQVKIDQPLQRDERKINDMVGDLANNSDIPESVMMAIQRTIDEPVAPTTVMNTQADSVSVASAAVSKKPLSSQKMSNQAISRNSLSFYAVDINKNSKNSNVANVEFHSDIIPERLSDAGTGTIFLEERLNGQNGLIRGTFLSGGFVPTKIDLSVEAGSYEFSIPLLSSYELNRFLSNENLSSHGGLLLIQLAAITDSVEIDAYYEAKIYLNSSFKVVESSEEYDFILFTGVTAGNVLINQRNFKNEVAQKIVHVTDDELYFEGGQFVESSIDTISLESINLLGRKNSTLDINSSDLLVFNTATESQKLAIGRYRIPYPLRSAGMRKYLEMTHLRGSIFVGYSSNFDLKIPSQELVYHIIDAHGLRSLENTCMIQVNFKNQVAEIEVFGESNKGPMALISTYLDNDGLWSPEPTEMTEQMFIAGDERGAISLRVEYLDGSKDFLQTFCSFDTYLVEQL